MPKEKSQERIEGIEGGPTVEWDAPALSDNEREPQGEGSL